MAFNFNWTPLIASASSPEFYSHAKELLTVALNKSAKSSVIVDSDVTVENLHLGHSAPELEVLEIGDLAQDRFRGVFRMTYDGDALVTVKARVQINPLCTYLNTSADFTSPHPLAVASTPLSIPVRLTLSEFKLSGFVILVFSKEKGITLVFRNDPLESMRVQSSFDSVPFIKNYLQKEIERQVRGLFQEELPLAVYKLSLRLLEPDDTRPGENAAQCEEKEQENVKKEEEESEDIPDPLFWVVNDGSATDVPSVSEKNMLCLHVLRNSQSTLSLFTPSISGAIYRATPPRSWAAAAATPAGTPSTDMPSRPGLHQSSSAMSLGGSRRKKKHRIVNLRKGKPAPEKSASTPSSSEGSKTVASAPGYLDRPRELSLVEERQPGSASWRSPSPICVSPPPPPPPQTPLSQTPPPPLSAPSTPLRSGYGMPVGFEGRPRLSRGQRYPSGIVEKAFMMRFVAEMAKQAEERRGEDSRRFMGY